MFTVNRPISQNNWFDKCIVNYLLWDNIKNSKVFLCHLPIVLFSGYNCRKRKEAGKRKKVRKRKEIRKERKLKKETWKERKKEKERKLWKERKIKRK